MLRSRQRGLGLIGLAIYAALAAAIAASVYGVYRHIVNTGRQEVLDEWAPIIARCNEIKGNPHTCLNDWAAAVDQRAQALAANAKLAQDFTVLETSAKACSANVEGLKIAADAADTERKKALAAKATALAELRNDKTAALTRAASSAGGTCEKQLGTITAGLVEVAAREMRDRPTPEMAAEMMGMPKPGSVPDAAKPARAPDPRLRVQ